MNKYLKKPLVAIAAGIMALSASLASAVEIEYWQYTYGSRVKAIDALIESFEAANPGITVKHTNFPYADYRNCLLYTSPSPRDATLSRMPSSA